MNWLSQNWGWIVLLVGGYLLMSRMGIGGCGMGMGHSHSHDHAGGHGSGTEDEHGRATDPVELVDPVSRHVLPAETAIASVHQGHVYYFEDRGNRDAFESDPDKYLAGVQLRAKRTESAGRNAHQGHGCC